MSSSVTGKTPSEQAPAGVVLGPDGKPCKPCTAFRNWKPTAGSKKAGTSKSFAALATGSAASASAAETDSRANCPADVEQLGRSTWTFLHTTAAYYPDKPSPSQRANMLNLLHALPTLYPCSHCASHLGENMKANPPDVSSRMGLSWWLCQRHNDVSERLGKPLFDCTKTDERWKDGPSDGSCD